MVVPANLPRSFHVEAFDFLPCPLVCLLSHLLQPVIPETRGTENQDLLFGFEPDSELLNVVFLKHHLYFLGKPDPPVRLGLTRNPISEKSLSLTGAFALSFLVLSRF